MLSWCHVFIVLLTVAMLNVVVLSVIMLNVVAPMLSLAVLATRFKPLTLGLRVKCSTTMLPPLASLCHLGIIFIQKSLNSFTCVLNMLWH